MRGGNIGRLFRLPGASGSEPVVRRPGYVGFRAATDIIIITQEGAGVIAGMGP